MPYPAGHVLRVLNTIAVQTVVKGFEKHKSTDGCGMVDAIAMYTSTCTTATWLRERHGAGGHLAELGDDARHVLVDALQDPRQRLLRVLPLCLCCISPVPTTPISLTKRLVFAVQHA